MTLNSTDWTLRYEANLGDPTPGSIIPISPQVISGFTNPSIAVRDVTINLPNLDWYTAGWIKQRLVSTIAPFTSPQEAWRKRFKLNDVTFIQFDINEPYSIELTFPNWIKNAHIWIWESTSSVQPTVGSGGGLEVTIR